MERHEIKSIIDHVEERLKHSRQKNYLKTLSSAGLVCATDFFDYSNWRSTPNLVDATQLLKEDQNNLLNSGELCGYVCEFIRENIRPLKNINRTRGGDSGYAKGWIGYYVCKEWGIPFEKISHGVVLCSLIHSGLQWQPMWSSKFRPGGTLNWFTKWGPTASLNISGRDEKRWLAKRNKELEREWTAH